MLDRNNFGPNTEKVEEERAPLSAVMLLSVASLFGPAQQSAPVQQAPNATPHVLTVEDNLSAASLPQLPSGQAVTPPLTTPPQQPQANAATAPVQPAQVQSVQIPNATTTTPATTTPTTTTIVAPQGNQPAPESKGIIFSELEKFWDDWRSKALGAFLAVAAAAGIIGGFRGAGKLINGLVSFFKDRENLKAGKCIASPSFNVHTFEETEDGELKLRINTIRAPAMADLFKNSYGRTLFSKAVDLCNEEHQFPNLTLGDADSLVKITLLQLPFYPKTLIPSPKADPAESRTERRELNEVIRDAYSTVYKDGIMAYESGLPVIRDEHYIIPLCDITKGKGRDLVFIAISQNNFARFADNNFVQKLVSDNPSQEERVKQLKAAYNAHTNFQRLIDTEPGEMLFPLVRTFVRNGHGEKHGENIKVEHIQGEQIEKVAKAHAPAVSRATA